MANTQDITPLTDAIGFLSLTFHLAGYLLVIVSDVQPEILAGLLMFFLALFEWSLITVGFFRLKAMYD